MASDEPKGYYDIVSPVRAFHVQVMEPKAFKGKNGKPTGEPKFSVQFGFPPTHPQFAEMKALVTQVALAKWPGRNLKADLASGKFVIPFSDGTKLADEAKAKTPPKSREDYRGLIVMGSRTQHEPKLSILKGSEIVDFDTVDDAKPHRAKYFYDGVEVVGCVNFKAYDGVGNNPDGVTAYLSSVVSLGRGPKAKDSGVPSNSERFRGHVGQASGVDPTGDDDDIPF